MVYLATPSPPQQPDRISETHPTDVFCWTRYGIESGEPIADILARKSVEAERNGGCFIWGVGNSVRPSLPRLIAESPRPFVRFSAMISPPRKQDVAPRTVRVWSSGVDWEGRQYQLPAHSVVTSNGDVTRSTHFALVCEHRGGLVESDQPELYASELRNLVQGSRVGASQVTAIVRRTDSGEPPRGPVYTRGFVARLVPPYFVTLTQSHTMPAPEMGEGHLPMVGGFEAGTIGRAEDYLPGF